MTWGIRGGGNPLNPFSSLLAQRYQRLNSLKLKGSLHKLATAQRINRGADDPAGLIASEQLRSTMAAMQAESQALERTDLQASTADGALGQISDMLVEARGLAVANANDAGLSDLEKQANQSQVDSILVSVDRISRSTSFAGTRLLDGSFSLTATNRTVEIDSTSSADLGEKTIDGDTYHLADLKSGGRLDTSESANVERAEQVLDAAASQVSTLRGRIGAFQKHTIASRQNSLAVAYENLKSAESQIRDLDYADEISRTVRYELLHRASLGTVKLINQTARRGWLDLRA
jgi:flagellin-like hook-associated protein FlgL